VNPLLSSLACTLYVFIVTLSQFSTLKLILFVIVLLDAKKNVNFNSCAPDSLANKLNLIRTAGTDFHNPKEHKIGLEVDENIFSELEYKIKTKTLKI
jgi:hypothetical protein